MFNNHESGEERVGDWKRVRVREVLPPKRELVFSLIIKKGNLSSI